MALFMLANDCTVYAQSGFQSPLVDLAFSSWSASATSDFAHTRRVLKQPGKQPPSALKTLFILVNDCTVYAQSGFQSHLVDLAFSS